MLFRSLPNLDIEQFWEQAWGKPLGAALFHENGITGEEEGYLGAGNQHELRISTESGTNTWHLWMSGTDFYLEGGMGDDTYIRHGFTYEDRDGNIGYFATNHYHITDAGGYNTYIGFPVAREEKDRKHDPEASLKGRWIQTADGAWIPSIPRYLGQKIA